MCGIFFSLSRERQLLPDRLTSEELVARGPDSYRALNRVLPDEVGDIHLTFVSSVLALRGDYVQEQPLHNPLSGSIFCWNGEAWKVDEAYVEGNDSTRVFDLLRQASQVGGSNHQQAVVSVLQRIAGPYAFVFYDASHPIVYYGRDRLGRRSLLVDRGEEDSLTLCSVSTATSLANGQKTEVSTASLHCIRFENGRITTSALPWLEPLPTLNKMTPSCPLKAAPSTSSIDDFLRSLKSATRLRVVDIPYHNRSEMQAGCAKAAILFSGGLDCTLLARVAHEILPQAEAVDLLNVAFENPRSIAATDQHNISAYELCPDRVTGRTSFSELCKVCPEREWRFVAIDVPYAESQAHKPTIQRLMRPHNTEMDLSIAMALYFAARGTGSLFTGAQLSRPETEHYASRARVLLSGLGADELYGGYSRHATAFARGGFANLAEELELDFTRIGSRNLGRDDRVMSHWGKEVRYPYLDEDLVKFSLALPVWEKCGFRVGRPIPKHYENTDQAQTVEDLEPAKMLLRVAMWKLGMRIAASERKRAIQFGARTAKMDIGKGRTRGTDILVDPS